MTEIINQHLRAIWYLAHLRPNGLKAAKINLERQSFKVFCPMYEVLSGVPAKARTAKRPLFPGYLFISVARESQPWRAINSTYGVSRLISLDPKGPNAVPQDFMSALIDRCDPNGVLRSQPGLEVGDKVEVLQGPFSKIVSTIEFIDSDKRIWMLLDLFGRKTKVGLSANDVWKL